MIKKTKMVEKYLCQGHHYNLDKRKRENRCLSTKLCKFFQKKKRNFCLRNCLKTR